MFEALVICQAGKNSHFGHEIEVITIIIIIIIATIINIVMIITIIIP